MTTLEHKSAGWLFRGDKLRYYSAFLMDIGLLMIMTAVPFIVVALGGTRTQAGDLLGYQSIVYMILSVFAALILDRLNPKRAVQFGSGGVAVAVIAMLVIILLASADKMDSPVAKLTVAVAAIGLPLTFFWPALMGWLSQGHEGQSLNKRLGYFNLSWSLGAILGPFLAGLFLGMDMTLTVLVIALFCILAFAAVSAAPYPTPAQATLPLADNQNQPPAGAVPQQPHHAYLRCCQWIGRISLFMSMFCVYACRTQLGLLMHKDLGYSEKNFGILMMLLSLANCAAMFSLSRVTLWHYRPIASVLFQIMLIAAMLVFAWASQLWLLIVGAAVLGTTCGFFYSSHLYYGVSGGKKRLARMAVHELILSCGAAAGAFTAGRLSDSYGVRIPYQAAAGLALLALILQLILWRTLRPGPLPNEINVPNEY